MKGVGGRRWRGNIDQYLAPSTETGHYWHIQRRHGKKQTWKFVMELFATKTEAASLWVNVYRNKKGFRLRHQKTYGGEK